MTPGGRILVDALIANGAERAYCVPGESFLPVLDALHDVAQRLPLVVCRHENGAAFMAEADGKLTGRPGIAFVTRGPGAANAAIGVHTARQDGTPMILFVGQVERGLRGREAFQEVDLVAMFAPLAKWAAQIDDPARIPEVVARAYATAQSGFPGPVVIALPEDVLAAAIEAPAAATASAGAAQLSPGDARRIRAELASARRPLVIVGGGAWSAAAAADIAAFAGRDELPVAVEFRCQDFIDNAHPSYVGVLSLGVQPKLAALAREADLIIAVGARLGEPATQGFTLLDVPLPRPRLIQIAPDAAEIGRVYVPALGLVADPRSAAAELRALPPIGGGAWSARTRAARAAFDASRTCRAARRGVDLHAFIGELQARIDPGAIVVNGAGNFSIWLHRFYTYGAYGTQLAPRCGAMGYGLPAAIAAKLSHPDRTVVCFCGDGDFLMTGSELATAMMYAAPIVVIVVNNGMYGTIRMHQERAYPGRSEGTALVNPDFAAYARAFGAYGEVVESTGAAAAAFERAVRAGAPAVLDLRVDPDALTPELSISALRAGRVAADR